MELVIIGHGRSGKDTAADWLSEHTPLCYHESTSEAAAQLCYRELRDKYSYTSVEEAFADRANHRKEWAEIIWQYNEPDGLTLYRGMLQTADILNGVRRASELQALRDAGMIDLVIWIARDVPIEASMEVTEADADITIQNNGTVEEFYQKLERLSEVLKIVR